MNWSFQHLCLQISADLWSCSVSSCFLLGSWGSPGRECSREAGDLVSPLSTILKMAVLSPVSTFSILVRNLVVTELGSTRGPAQAQARWVPALGRGRGFWLLALTTTLAAIDTHLAKKRLVFSSGASGLY